MKPLSNAERQKRKLRSWENEGKYEDFKKKKAEARKLSCKKQEENVTEKESEIAKLKKRYRCKSTGKRRKVLVQAAALTCVNAYGSKSSETKAKKACQKLYWKAQEKRELLFKNLSRSYFQNKLCFKEIKSKKPSVLFD